MLIIGQICWRLECCLEYSSIKSTWLRCVVKKSHGQSADKVMVALIWRCNFCLSGVLYSYIVGLLLKIGDLEIKLSFRVWRECLLDSCVWILSLLIFNGTLVTYVFVITCLLFWNQVVISYSPVPSRISCSHAVHVFSSNRTACARLFANPYLLCCGLF